MIKAFLFDVDGVLTPSADVSAALVSRYFASKSLSIKEDEVVPFMGKGMKALLEESAKYLNTEISLDEALSFFRENYSKELKERKPKEKARESGGEPEIYESFPGRLRLCPDRGKRQPQ